MGFAACEDSLTAWDGVGYVGLDHVTCGYSVLSLRM